MSYLAIDDFFYYAANSESAIRHSCHKILRKIKSTLKFNDNARKTKLYIFSSCELMFFGNKIVRKHILQLLNEYKGLDISVLSLGCIGFYSAILDFMDRQDQQAIIWSIDVPRNKLQQMMDELSKQNLSINYVVRSFPSMYLITLSKQEKFVKGLNYIHSLHILGLPKAISSTFALARKINSTLVHMQQVIESSIVSFRIESGWSEILERALMKLNDNEKHYTSVLPSLEKDDMHLHSLKPVLEMAHYRSYISDQHGLIIPCLAAGGRVGIMQISKANVQYSFEKVEKHVIDLPSRNCAIENFQSLSKVCDNLDSCKQMTDHFYFMDKKYRAKDNFYFEWLLKGSS